MVEYIRHLDNEISVTLIAIQSLSVQLKKEELIIQFRQLSADSY